MIYPPVGFVPDPANVLPGPPPPGTRPRGTPATASERPSAAAVASVSGALSPLGWLTCLVCSGVRTRAAEGLPPHAFPLGVGFVCHWCQLQPLIPLGLDPPTDTPPPVWARLLAAAEAMFSSPWSLATGRLYAYQIRRLVAISLKLRLQLLPMTHLSQVKVYFTYLGTELGWAWGTIATARSAISAWHEAAGLPHALRLPASIFFFSAVQRHLGTRRAKPKEAMSFSQFTTLCLALHGARSLLHWRDLAMLVICFIGMRRMSDVLVGRTADRPTSGVRCCDLDFSDPTSVGLRLRGLKNDPFGKGHTIYFPARTGSGIPVRQILLDYLTMGGLSPLSEAPLIQGTVGSKAARLSGLPYASWSSRLKQISDRYLAPDHGLTTRSLRKGGASHAHSIGVSADHIRAVGCWDSEAFNLYIARSRASILGVTQRF